MAYCPNPPTALFVYTRFRSFVSTPAIRFAHDAAPRFGNTANITKLFVGSSEEASDYLKGLVSGAVLTALLFVVWLVLLLVFRCGGPKYFGWLSGSRIPLPPNEAFSDEQLDAQENDLHLQVEGSTEKTGDAGLTSENASGDKLAEATLEDVTHQGEVQPEQVPADTTDILKGDDGARYEAWNKRYLALTTQDRRMRVCVIISAIAIIVCSILMVSKGVPGLNAIVDDGRVSLTKGMALTEEAISVAAQGEAVLKQTASAMKELHTAINTTCPNLLEDLCSDTEDLDTCSSDGVFVQTITASYEDALDAVQDVQKELENLNADIQTAFDSLDNVDWLFHLSSFFAILLAFHCTALLFALCFKVPSEGIAWVWIRRLSRCLFFPIFILLVLVAFSFAIAFIVASTGMADACAESPDEKVQYILINKQESMNIIAAEVAEYYLNGCRKIPPPTVQNALVFGSNVLGAFGNEMKNETQLAKLEDVCGPFDEAKWIELAFTLSETMCSGADVLENLRGLFDCRTWFGLYASVAYDTLCYNTDAMSMVAFTQLFVVIFAFVTATFRVSIYQGIEISPVQPSEESKPPPAAVEVDMN